MTDELKAKIDEVNKDLANRASEVREAVNIDVRLKKLEVDVKKIKQHLGIM